MTHKIIKNDNYLLVVDDSEIKEGDYYTHNQKPIGIRVFKFTGPLPMDAKKILAHLPLNGSPVLEGVDFLPALEDGVDELAEAFGNNIGDEEAENIAVSFGYKSGYNKAREKYKYSRGDMRKAWKAGQKYGETSGESISFEEFLEELDIPQYPTEFECETITEVSSLEDVKEVPKTTTINGRRTWVGKYK